MYNKLRKSPPVCLGISLLRILILRLKYSNKYLGNTIEIDKGQKFIIFRHITTYPLIERDSTTVFIVSFKFASLTHKVNKIASIIPMLLITGFPGFDTKIYAVNKKNGYWMGMYQWKSKLALEDYKGSFVFKMMNKRATKDTLSSAAFENQKLINFIESNKIQYNEVFKNP